LNRGPLRVGFGGLFDIFVDTYISVAEIRRLGLGEEGEG